MMTTLTLYVAGLVVLCLVWRLTTGRAPRTERPAPGDLATWRKRFWMSALTVGAWVALIRVGILWYLVYREWTGTQSLSFLPLVLLLFPEGLLLSPASGEAGLTITRVVLLSLLLSVGSLAMTIIARGLIAIASRVPSPR